MMETQFINSKTNENEVVRYFSMEIGVYKMIFSLLLRSFGIMQAGLM